MKNIFKLLTVILTMSTFNSCTTLMSLTGSEKADAELRNHIYEEAKTYCAVRNTRTGKCVKWEKAD